MIIYFGYYAEYLPANIFRQRILQYNIILVAELKNASVSHPGVVGLTLNNTAIFCMKGIPLNMCYFIARYSLLGCFLHPGSS